MPMLTDLRRRLLADPQPEQDGVLDGEVLIADTRSQLSPSQQVEQKLREFLIGRNATAKMATRQRPKPR
jgi:hypothetical protein